MADIFETYESDYVSLAQSIGSQIHAIPALSGGT